MPEKPVIVFDGECVLCSRWVDFLLKHDRDAKYRLAAMQGDAGSRLMREHGLDPDEPSSLLLVENGRAYTDSGAILRILDGLGGWYSLAVLAYGVPPFLLDPAYRFVARNRYRLFGRRDECRVPDEAERHRFLD